MTEKVSCSEMLKELEDKWEKSLEGEQSYLMSRMVRASCQEVVPYLYRHLASKDSLYRERALRGLGKFKRREYRLFESSDPRR